VRIEGEIAVLLLVAEKGARGNKKSHAPYVPQMAVMSYMCSYYPGLPHYINMDDIYNGYLIPGGSIVILNLWLVILHLESMPVH
jgi:hypothetical protein